MKIALPLFIAENQLERLVADVPNNGVFFEFGSGGSSVWIKDHLPDGARHLAIECDHEWARKIADRGVQVIGTQRSYRRTRTVLDDGSEAFQPESTEITCFDPAYICCPYASEADVVLVDGYNRGACVTWSQMTCKPGTILYLHDCNTDEVAWIYLLPWEEKEVIESEDPENPSPMLRVVIG